ncbi:hypothetical protein D1224_04485 [Henriciella barbarensis]|uniref:Uncharacterized protein n=1 Tax=Henriciella barbarensis TaxID=86342 RepID=A0A399QZN4_9PROT|nr:hypothetical protein [Henriciella barbarensis]RIJ23525.1 hypothetical protein D1224_04485 [Henriciella barbarensis]
MAKLVECFPSFIKPPGEKFAEEFVITSVIDFGEALGTRQMDLRFVSAKAVNNGKYGFPRMLSHIIREPQDPEVVAQRLSKELENRFMYEYDDSVLFEKLRAILCDEDDMNRERKFFEALNL